MRIAVALVAALLLASSMDARAEEPGSPERFGEAMTVVRYLIEARVTDAAGRPVTDVPASEFVVTIGDAVAKVESADWISFTQIPGAPEAAMQGEAQAVRPFPGRLVVFFVQTDFARDPSRIKGQMTFATFFAEKVVGMLRTDDKVAVVAFDSHLEVLCDFTSDRDEVLRALKEPFDAPKARRAATGGPSLLASIDEGEAKRAARGETALLLVARALARIDGDKLMFLAGWSFGDMIWGAGGGGQLVLPPAYSEAVGLLYRDRTPVVTIGTGRGQLTAGIALTARATGGLHTSAFADFPEQMLTRIDGFVAGSYELVLRTDAPLAPGEYPITVRAKDSRLQVRAVPAIVIDAVDTRWADAVALLNAGLTDDGVRMLRDSMSGAHLPGDVLRERIDVLAAAGQWEAVLAVIEKLATEEEIDAEVAQLRDEARKGVAAKARVSAQARLVEARKLMLDGVQAGALARLDEAVALDPGFAEPWYERGMLLLALGKADAAATDLRRYLELAPRGANAETAREVLAGLAP